jgi:hypothetical protein
LFDLGRAVYLKRSTTGAELEEKKYYMYKQEMTGFFSGISMRRDG